MSKRHHWQVYRYVKEIKYVNGLGGANFETEREEILIEGSKAKCESFYKKNGGSKNGLHLGYVIPD